MVFDQGSPEKEPGVLCIFFISVFIFYAAVCFLLLFTFAVIV